MLVERICGNSSTLPEPVTSGRLTFMKIDFTSSAEDSARGFLVYVTQCTYLLSLSFILFKSMLTFNKKGKSSLAYKEVNP